MLKYGAELSNQVQTLISNSSKNWVPNISLRLYQVSILNFFFQVSRRLIFLVKINHRTNFTFISRSTLLFSIAYIWETIYISACFLKDKY